MHHSSTQSQSRHHTQALNCTSKFIPYYGHAHARTHDGDHQAMAYAPPQADEPELIAGHLEQGQRRLLDAGRILVIGGWLVLTYTATSNDRAASAVHALVGLALLLLGFLLILLSPVANQLPGAAGAVVAALADAVLFYTFAPAN